MWIGPRTPKQFAARVTVMVIACPLSWSTGRVGQSVSPVQRLNWLSISSVWRPRMVRRRLPLRRGWRYHRLGDLCGVGFQRDRYGLRKREPIWIVSLATIKLNSIGGPR